MFQDLSSLFWGFQEGFKGVSGGFKRDVEGFQGNLYRFGGPRVSDEFRDISSEMALTCVLVTP